MVHPVVLGVGKCLFEDREDRRSLELIDTKTFGTGVVSLAYRPTWGEGGLVASEGKTRPHRHR